MAAKETLLGQIHEKAAKKMLAMLESEELTAAELSVITKFLKDNGINCDPEESEEMKKLQEKTGGKVLQFPFNPNEVATG